MIESPCCGLWGHLYNFSTTCYYNVPYFSRKAKELMHDLTNITEQFEKNAELQLIKDDVSELRRYLKSANVRIFVPGPIHLAVNDLVQRLHAKRRKPTLVHDVTTKAFGHKLLDMVVCLQKQLPQNAAHADSSGFYRQAAASGKLLVVRAADTNVSTDVHFTATAVINQSTVAIGGYDVELSDLTEVNRRLSIALEGQIVRKLSNIHKKLQSVLDSLYILPVNTISEIVRPILGERRYIAGWKMEYRSPRCCLKADWSCQHDLDYTNWPCSECYMIYRLSRVLSKCITDAIIKDFDNCDHRLAPRKWYTKEWREEISRQTQEAMEKMLKSIASSEVSSIGSIYKSSQMRDQMRDFYLDMVLDLYRVQLMSQNESMSNLCHSLLCVLNQSVIPGVKAFPRQTSTTSSIRRLPYIDLFKSCNSVTSVGYHFNRVQVYVDPSDYTDIPMVVECEIRELFCTKGIDPKTVDIIPQVSKHQMQTTGEMRHHAMDLSKGEELETKVFGTKHKIDKPGFIYDPRKSMNTEGDNGLFVIKDCTGAEGDCAQSPCGISKTLVRQDGSRDRCTTAKGDNVFSKRNVPSALVKGCPSYTRLYSFDESIFPKYRVYKNQMKILEDALQNDRTSNDGRIFSQFEDNIKVLAMGENSHSMSHILSGYQDVRDISTEEIESKSLWNETDIAVVLLWSMDHQKSKAIAHEIRRNKISPDRTLFLNFTRESNSAITKQYVELCRILPETVIKVKSWNEIRPAIDDVLERRVLQKGIKLEEFCQRIGADATVSAILDLYKTSSLTVTPTQICLLKQDLDESFGNRYRSFTPNESTKTITVRFAESQINKTETEKILRQIRHGNGIFHRLVSIPDAGDMQFYKGGVGSKVRTNDERHGSLGGFAEAYVSHKRNHVSCVLVSRHVVEEAETVVLETDSMSITLGACIAKGKGLLDIAALVLEEPKRSHLETKFKNSKGHFKSGRLLGISDDPVESLTDFLNLGKVYIWGAESRPGRGLVQGVRYGMLDQEGSRCDMLEIIDFTTDEKFCKDGDSGAIVFADNLNDDEKIDLVAMVVGHQGNIHLCFKLFDGLTKMKSNSNITQFIVGDSKV